MLEQITDRAIRGRGCTKAEALWLATSPREPDLLRAATQVREAFFAQTIQLCSIISAKSGRCAMDCRFCSQSSHHSTGIEPYPFLKKDDLKQRIAKTLSSNDRHCGIVTSGEKLSDDELEVLTAVVTEIGGGNPVPVCASLGRLTGAELAKLKGAGLTRFHHNLESSEHYYPEVCSTQQWSQRLETAKAAQAAGLDVCCGGLFGLGESWEDRIELATTLRELGIDSVPINFLYSHDGTPLGGRPPLAASEALRIIALYRILLPKATLRICGGRIHVLGDREAELFAAGANGLMTGNYLTVAGSPYAADLAMIENLGLKIAAP